MDLSEINDVISVRWFRQAFTLRYVLLIAVSLQSEMVAVGVGGGSRVVVRLMELQLWCARCKNPEQDVNKRGLRWKLLGGPWLMSQPRYFG